MKHILSRIGAIGVPFGGIIFLPTLLIEDWSGWTLQYDIPKETYNRMQMALMSQQAIFIIIFFFTDQKEFNPRE